MKSLMLKYVWVTVITIKYRRYLSACAKMLGSLVAKKLLYWMFYTSDGVRRHCIKWYWKERSYWIVFARISLILMEFRLFFQDSRFRMMLQHFKWITTFFCEQRRLKEKLNQQFYGAKADKEWGFKAFKTVDWLNRVIRNWIVFAVTQKISNWKYNSQ